MKVFWIMIAFPTLYLSQVLQQSHRSSWVWLQEEPGPDPNSQHLWHPAVISKMLLPLSPIQKPSCTKLRNTREKGSWQGRWTKQRLHLDLNSTGSTPKPTWRQLDPIAVAQAPAVRKGGVSWALEHSSALSIPPSDIKKKNHTAQNRVPSKQADELKGRIFFTQSVLSSQPMLNKMFPHLIHASVTKCRFTLHKRENVKVLVGYIQLEHCMGFSGCYTHQLYLDLRESDIILFNAVLVYIEGFLGILWEVTKNKDS